MALEEQFSITLDEEGASSEPALVTLAAPDAVALAAERDMTGPHFLLLLTLSLSVSFRCGEDCHRAGGCRPHPVAGAAASQAQSHQCTF